MKNRDQDKTRINRLQLEEVEEKVTDNKIYKREKYDNETTKKTKRK